MEICNWGSHLFSAREYRWIINEIKRDAESFLKANSFPNAKTLQWNIQEHF